MKRILVIALAVLLPINGWTVPPPHPPVGGGGSGLTGGTTGNVVKATGATTIGDSGVAASNLFTLTGDQSAAGTKTFTGVLGSQSTLTGADWSDLAPGILRSVLIYEGHSATPSLLQGGAIWARTDAQSNGAVAPVGTLQGISSYMHIKNSGSSSNEYTPLAINLSAEAQGRFWGIDASVLGPVNVQANLLTGPTFFIGNYNAGTITAGSVGLTVITKPDGGGGDASNDRIGRLCYPIDIGIAIVGQSGNEDDTVTQGFKTALQIGGNAGGWADGSGSKAGTGIDLSQFDNYGIYIHDPTGSGPAIATAAGAGKVGFGLTAPSAQLHVLSTTEQLRIGYDTSNYYKTTVGSTGTVTFDAVGAGAGFTFSDNVVISTLPATAVLFSAGAGLISQDVAHFYYDQTHHAIVGNLFGHLLNSDFTDALYNDIDGDGWFVDDQPGFRAAIGLGTIATVNQGAVTDGMLASAVKPAVAVVAASNLTLSGEQTIDGVTTVGSLVLCTAQSTGSQNGPWITASGSWTRPTWYTNGSTTQAPQFLTTFVRLGTTYQGSTWRMTTASVTIGTTATTWVQTPIALGNLGGLGTGVATFLTTPTSANLAAAVTDENGSGKLIFAQGTLSIASGKTLTASNSITFTGTDGATLAIGAGGTLGSGAYASAFDPTAPGAIGGGTPSTGAFTTLTNTGAATNSKSGAASTAALLVSGVPFAGTGTTSFPLFYINDANATASTTLNTAGTYLGVNGDGTQDLMNLLKDGTSQFKVASSGNITTTAAIVLPTADNQLVLGDPTHRASIIYALNIWGGGGNITLNAGGGGSGGSIKASSDFIFTTDNSNDIGASGATRPRTIYVGTDVNAGGNLVSGTAGKGLQIKGGSNAKIGSGTLSGGTATISTTAVTANSRIFVTDTNTGSLVNVGSLVVSTKTAGTSFVVTSTNALDASTFDWMIVEQN